MPVQPPQVRCTGFLLKTLKKSKMYIKVRKAFRDEMQNCARQLWEEHFYGAEVLLEMRGQKYNESEYMGIVTLPYSPQCFPKGKSRACFERGTYASATELYDAMIAYAEELYQSACIMYNQEDYAFFRKISAHEDHYRYMLSHKFVNMPKEWQAEKCLAYKNAGTDEEKLAIIEETVNKLKTL